MLLKNDHNFVYGVYGKNYLWWSSTTAEKMELKCTLHGSSASIMSVQFDQHVCLSVCDTYH